jgi:hypothetical protein
MGAGSVVGAIVGLGIGRAVGSKYVISQGIDDRENQVRDIGMAAGALLFAVIGNLMFDPVEAVEVDTWVQMEWPKELW